MARYRLKSAHYLAGDKWLPGDAENQHLGDERGTIVGDGTDHEVKWPTLEMEPLDAEAEEMIEREKARLAANNAAMNPLDELPLEMDQYEQNYVPGLNVRRKKPAADGAPVREKTNA
jgi:hypothetical protein